MPATALDPKTALVIIDLQRGLEKMPTLVPFDTIVARNMRLVDAFRARSLPIVFVRVNAAEGGVDWARTRNETGHVAPPSSAEFFAYVPDLAAKPGDIEISKRNWSAFYGTDLELQLRRRGVTGIVLTGIATSIGVDSTARAAHERSFNLTIATDAVTDLDEAAHTHSLTKIFPRMAELDTTDAIVKLLQA